MIGRERACDLFRGAVARAAAGDSAFVLVVGEPGIGKTTLLHVFSELAADGGLLVGHGRGEPEGSAPLWPWTSALNGIDAGRRRASSRPSGRAEPGALREGGSVRFAAYERFATELSGRAAECPVALVVDDLQWADLSALRLFRHLAERPSLPGVLVAGGLRTTEPLAGEVAEVVSGLIAHPAIEVVELSPFSKDEIGAFAGERLARSPSEDELTVLAQRSGGNPFFLGELLRWVPAAGSAVEWDAALPLAVRESVRRRLVVEDEQTQHVVRAAAVASTVPSLDLLARITELGPADVSRALDAADRAGLVVVATGRDGSVSFVHDLVRQAVLSLLPTWGRIELHRAVGMALRDDVRSSSWAAVASHLRAARPLVEAATLADAARQAAAEATRAGAFDEAADHLAVTFDAREAAGDRDALGELWLERGRVLWAAERPVESKAALGEAAAMARRTGDGELLARIALSWRGGEFRYILRRSDDQFLALLREALSAYPSVDSRLRGLLLSQLARCAFWDIGDPEGIAACEDAVAMARRLGDAEVLTTALGTRFYYRWRPELARERLAIADEIVAVAVAADEAALIAPARCFRLLALLDLGRLNDAWGELDRFEAAVIASGQPLLRVRALWFRVTQHLARGERSAADALADEATSLAARMGRPDAAVERLGQSLLLSAAEDQVDDVLEQITPHVLDPMTTNSVVAIANGFGGRAVEAHAALDAVATAGFGRIPRDMAWIFGNCGLLVAAVVSGDREHGRILYEALEPLAGQWAVLNPGIMVAGAVDHYLGLGAALLDRPNDAVVHLRRAVAAHESQDAVTLALLSLQELRTVLTRRREPADDVELATVERRIRRLGARNTVPFKSLLHIMWSAPEASAVGVHLQRLVLEGDTWLVEFAGGRARLRDQRGLHHLRALLERPGIEIPALTLAAADHGLAGSVNGTILDPQAMRAYRQRITDLDEDIDEAAANNDIERSATAQAERDTLIEELAAATGVGGRSRHFTGADERARVSVTKAIRAAINHLGEQLPELSRHLSATVRTGSRCVYRPDPRALARWKTERL